MVAGKWPTIYGARLSTLSNRAEPFWSALRRAYQDTQHKLSEKDLGNCANEFTGCRGMRLPTTLDQMDHTVRRTIRRRLRYRDFVSGDGLESCSREVVA